MVWRFRLDWIGFECREVASHHYKSATTSRTMSTKACFSSVLKGELCFRDPAQRQYTPFMALRKPESALIFSQEVGDAPRRARSCALVGRGERMATGGESAPDADVGLELDSVLEEEPERPSMAEGGESVSAPSLSLVGGLLNSLWARFESSESCASPSADICTGTGDGPGLISGLGLIVCSLLASTSGDNAFGLTRLNCASERIALVSSSSVIRPVENRVWGSRCSICSKSKESEPNEGAGRGCEGSCNLRFEITGEGIVESAEPAKRKYQ